MMENGQWRMDNGGLIMVIIHFPFSIFHFPQLRISPEVIEGLRKETRDIDAVGRREAHVGLEVRVHESALDEGLTVVEHAVDLNSRNVLPERSELALLDGRHLALGVEDVDVDALHAEETVGDGRTRIAGGGHKDIDRRPALGPSRRGGERGKAPLQEPRHEASAHILEGKRGTVEEFERVDVRLDLDNRRVEREGVVDDASEVVGRNIFAEERVGHAVGYFLERELGHLVPKRGGQLLDDLGHIEPLVLRESADDSLAQCGATGFVVCAVV